MQEAMFGSKPSLVVRFSRGGNSGVVRAYYGITSRAADGGFSAVKGWRQMSVTGTGFPAIKCSVESDRPGYWGYLGWVQVLTQEFSGKSAPIGKVDQLPSFLRVNSPFLSVGYAPSVFDAPAFDARPPDEFRARLFLCTLPIMSRREAIAPLAGLRWGFHRRIDGEGHVPHALEEATADDWRKVRDELVERNPGWSYAPRFIPARRNSR